MMKTHTCLWRESRDNGFLCHSPKYIAPPNQVTLSFCETCTYAEPCEPVVNLKQHKADRNELRQFEWRLRSQNGEDGIIAEILRRTQTVGLAVEVGAHHAYGNCYLLAERSRPVMFIERDVQSLKHLVARCHGPHVSYKLAHITAENANVVVHKETAILSIDIDGNDYWVWRALECRPDLVVIEFNHVPPPPQEKAIVYDPNHAWDGTTYYGASLSALYELGKSKGYILVGTDSAQCNAYFVLSHFEDRFRAVTPEEIWESPRWSHRESSRQLVDIR